MATPSNTNTDQTSNSPIVTYPDDDTKKKEDDEKRESLSTASTEHIQGTVAEKTNESNEHHVTIAEPVGGFLKTTTTTVTTSSSGDIPHSEESYTTTASSDTKESNVTTTARPPSPIQLTEEKKNFEAVSSTTSTETTVKKERSGSTSSTSEKKDDSDLKKEESAPQLKSSISNKSDADDFRIEKGHGIHLTSFQRQKAKYFFNVNLDIENKEYLTWDDVEFYLLFHATAAGKEGADGGDLEGRLSRAARALWEHIHDQIPSSDKNRDRLTLSQFLDTWASLVDYVIQHNRLPTLVQDLVKLGFELYSVDNHDGKSAAITPNAFDQLFQKMGLGRPYALMAYKVLTDNGTATLNADKIDSLVRAVITSSDDEHNSHFLLPGFFKTIANNQNRNRSPSPVPGNTPSESTTGKATPSSPSATTKTQTFSTVTETKNTQPDSTRRGSQTSPSTPYVEQPKSPKPTEQSSPSQPSKPADRPPSPKPPTTGQQSRSSNVGQQQQQSPTENGPSPQKQPLPPKVILEQEDESIRRLLHYYHIDDGDIVEVSAGSVPRVLLVHPERPVPTYIRQNKELMQKLHLDPATTPSAPAAQNNNNENLPFMTKRASVPFHDSTNKVKLEERVARGEASTGPSVPFRPEAPSNKPFVANARQVYPTLSPAEQEQQQRQAKVQANAPAGSTQGEKKDENSMSSANDRSSSRGPSKEKIEFTHEDEEKIVASVLKQLTPLVEKRVSEELRRLQSGDTDDDNDDDGFLPFPFMFAGGAPFFAAGPAGPQRQEHQAGVNQGQPRANQPSGMNLEGLPPGAAFLPPQLLMAMMSDLAQNGPPGGVPRGPAGAEGFMMFVDADPVMGGASRPGPPRF